MLQDGTALAPLGHLSAGIHLSAPGIDTCRLRTQHLLSLGRSILRSEGFSIAVGFVMSVLMMALLWFTCNIFY